MNFQQLKIIRESARCNYNLTEVANTLFTSQSGVSRHIRELEEELGIEIFIRRGKRLLGMTEPGKELLVVAERILNDANNIRRLADVFSSNDSGSCISRRRTPRRAIACRGDRRVSRALPTGAGGAQSGQPGGDRLDAGRR